jgi:RHS repeat-associated protein
LKKENKSNERTTATYTVRLKVEYYSNTKALINSSVQDFPVSSGVWVNLSPNNIQISQNNIAFVKFIVINPNSFPIFIDDWSIKETGKVILQENHYYPYGKEISSLGKKGTHEFLYQGKERNEEFGLEQDDFEWRMYDFNFPCTTTIDPHAEKYVNWSPYSWVAGNPINTIDPDGRDFRLIIDLDDKGEISKVTIQTTVHLYGKDAKGMASFYKKEFDKLEKSPLINFDVNFKEHKSQSSAVNSMKQGDNLIKVDTDMTDDELKTFYFYEKSSKKDVSTTTGLAKIGKKEANVRSLGSLNHELGHLFGLDERYDKDTGKNFKGFYEDIMGTKEHPTIIHSVHSQNLFNFVTNDKEFKDYKKRNTFYKVYSEFGRIPETDNLKK